MSGAPALQRRLTLAGIIVALTVTRMLVAAQTGLGDAEAYYWTWSQALGGGYFDHGPVVAWLIRAATALGGDRPWVVRFPFILCSAATLVVAARVARRIAPEVARAPIVVCAALLAMPMFIIAGGAANPDVPLGLWTVLLVAVLLGRPLTTRRAAVAGLIVGLAISTKLLAVLLMPWLLHRAWGASRRWWVLAAASAGALFGALPPLLWNAAHGWPSLRYHLVLRHSRPPGPSWENLAKLVAGQLAYVSPFVWFALLVLALALGRERRRASAAYPLASELLWAALPPLFVGWALILVIPGAEPHWPAFGYLPLVCALGCRWAHWRSLRPRRTAWLTAGALGWSALIAVALHVHVLTDLGVRLMPAGYVARYDLSNELRGWPEVAEAVVASLQRRTPRDSGRPVLVAGCHYTSCAQLRFAAAGRFPVICPSPRLDHFDFARGGDGSSRRGVDLLYIEDERFPYPAAELYRCERVVAERTLALRRAGRTVRRFGLQRCLGFGGLRALRWPPR